MRTISRRLEKLEARFAPLVETKDERRAADLRAKLHLLVGHVGEPLVAQLERLLEEVGPNRFPAELIRAYLSADGFVQGPHESLAETLTRALGIVMRELRSRIQQGQLGLVSRFEKSEIAADNAINET
jgi:hypothetical protein